MNAAALLTATEVCLSRIRYKAPETNKSGIVANDAALAVVTAALQLIGN